MKKLENEILIYQGDANLQMKVKTDGETVWLTQEQMCQLFGRERSVITKHVRNIFKEGELEERVVCAKFAHTTLHGAIIGKTQTRDVFYYNLDVVISVGYRVNRSRPSAVTPAEVLPGMSYSISDTLSIC